MSTPDRPGMLEEQPAAPIIEVGAAATGQRRRRARWALAGLPGLAVVILAAALWLGTPSTADLQPRVAAIDAAAHSHSLAPSDVPPLLTNAFVAVEDERFFAHHGLDTLGTGRAVLDDVTQRCLCEGGSTITQQLAKLVYYPEDGRLSRKLPSMALAFKIEARYSKVWIMADYVSVVQTGFGLVGAAQASCAYFGHNLSTLTIAEAAELAGSVQAPSAYDPRTDPSLMHARRAYALRRMVEVGYISPAEASTANSAPVLADGEGHSPNC